MVFFMQIHIFRALKALYLAALALGFTSNCVNSQPFPPPSNNATDDTCPIRPPFAPAEFASLVYPVCLPADAAPLQSLEEFLSFEDWKSMKLSEEASAQPPKRPANASSEDSSSYRSADVHVDPAPEATYSTPPSFQQVQMNSPRVPLTDRFNYASSECSARIYGAHKSLSSPFGILTSKKDKYMLSPCAARDKFVIVELCDDIQIGEDTVSFGKRHGSERAPHRYDSTRELRVLFWGLQGYHDQRSTDVPT
jgi:hypothetical protein